MEHGTAEFVFQVLVLPDELGFDRTIFLSAFNQAAAVSVAAADEQMLFIDYHRLGDVVVVVDVVLDVVVVDEVVVVEEVVVEDVVVVAVVPSS